MKIGILPAAILATLLTSTAVASADWTISVANGTSPFLTFSSIDNAASRASGYYGPCARAQAYYWIPRYQYWRRW